MLPWFLILKLPRGTAIEPWTDCLAQERCTILAAQSDDAVVALETGSKHEAIILARFYFEADLRAAWANMRHLTAVGDDIVALASPGLAWEGWPGDFVPTIATVHVPASDSPRAYMLIEGGGTDQSRLDQYRDIILPMLRDRGGYYVLFALGGGVEVLHGGWDESVLAISRWPSRATAEDFWHCERYQTVAIPIRTGVSRFDVQLFEGTAG